MLTTQPDILASLRQIPCPFAASACGVALEAPVGGADYLGAVLGALDALSRDDDFLALPLPLPAHGPGNHDLVAMVHAILLRLAGPAMLYAAVESSSWRLRTATGDYFPFVMSAGYSSRHPRYIDWPQPLLLLQPELSFSRHGICSTSVRRSELSAATERAFRRRGRDYLGDVTRLWPKSLRVIKPCHVDEPPIRWWRTPPIIDRGWRICPAPVQYK